MSRYTREMFCLMEGRHVHPSTLYPGGVGTVPIDPDLHRLLVRLMSYVEFMKKVVPLHDDLFDFFYEALPGYEEGRPAPHPAGLLGFVPGSGRVRLQLRRHGSSGAKPCTSRPASSLMASSSRPISSISISAFAFCSASSYYEDWENWETFVKNDPLGNPVDKRHPVESDHDSETAEARLRRQLHLGDVTALVRSRRTGDHLALDTGGGPIARLWATALAGLVDIGYVKSTGHSVKIRLPKTAMKPEVEFEWKIPQWSNAIERDRARTYFQAYAAAARCTSWSKR